MGQRVFTQLEVLARQFQLKYMASKRTSEVIEPGRICFHPQDARKWVLASYQEKLKELKVDD